MWVLKEVQSCLTSTQKQFSSGVMHAFSPDFYLQEICWTSHFAVSIMKHLALALIRGTNCAKCLPILCYSDYSLPTGGQKPRIMSLSTFCTPVFFPLGFELAFPGLNACEWQAQSHRRGSFHKIWYPPSFPIGFALFSNRATFLTFALLYYWYLATAGV